MTTVLVLILLALAVPALISYTRHDRFAGPRNTARRFDDLGTLGDAHHVRC